MWKFVINLFDYVLFGYYGDSVQWEGKEEVLIKKEDKNEK